MRRKWVEFVGFDIAENTPKRLTPAQQGALERDRRNLKLGAPTI